MRTGGHGQECHRCSNTRYVNCLSYYTSGSISIHLFFLHWRTNVTGNLYDYRSCIRPLKSLSIYSFSTAGRKNVSGVQLRDLQYTSERFSTHFLLLYVTWTVVNFSKSFQSFVILSSLFDTALNPPEFNSNSLSDAEAQRINQTNKQNMQTQQTLYYMYKCN